MAYPRQPTTLSPLPTPPPKCSTAAASEPSRVHPDLLYRRNLASPLPPPSQSHGLPPLLHFCHASLSISCRGWFDTGFRNRFRVKGNRERERDWIFIESNIISPLNSKRRANLWIIFVSSLGWISNDPSGSNGGSASTGLRRENAGIIRGRPRKFSSPPGERRLDVESSRSVSLIRNLTYLTKSFELVNGGEGRREGSKLWPFARGGTRMAVFKQGMPGWRLFLKRVSNELNSPSSESFLSFFSILDSHRPFPLSRFLLVENVSRISRSWILSTEECRILERSSFDFTVWGWKRTAFLISILFKSRGLNNIRFSEMLISILVFFFIPTNF